MFYDFKKSTNSEGVKPKLLTKAGLKVSHSSIRELISCDHLHDAYSRCHLCGMAQNIFLVLIPYFFAQ